MAEPVTIPLLNPNEPEANLAALHIREGQRVSIGDTLVTLETTKSTAELQAERSGYVIGLLAEQGQTLMAGAILCYIADAPDWTPPTDVHIDKQTHDTSVSPTGMRITQPARALASQFGIDLNRLPTDRLVTESIVRAMLETSDVDREQAPYAGEFDPSAILVYGGGGHGKALIDLLLALRIYRIVGILDDGLPPGELIMDLPVLGGEQSLTGLYAQGIRQAVNAVGGIGNINIRIKVFQRLAKAGFVCPAVVHPRAYVEPSAALNPGGQVFAQSYVGSEAAVGFGCIVNTGAIVSHDCVLGDYANISPGAILAGEVQIGTGALIGMGATVNLRVRVGAGARIGNGATVKEDVPEKGIVRAGAVWP
jgi:sugar O-acyltransferase (sialic acid O-acetyltransferase NeuD family)